jgi:isoaspartyl peptidase/L-asparaginase-like protein (Ntn-hydrolase superfamily)
MKSVLVFDILKRVEYKGTPIRQASQEACDEMLRFYDDDGGVIGLDNQGNVAIGFSSDQMSWAYQNNDEIVRYGINPGDDYQYNIAECRNKNCFE